jgi:hypothetical protein
MRVIGQLELTHPMRLQAMSPPDALNRADADPGRLGHRGPRPMGGVRRRPSQGQGHNALGNAGTQRWNARRARLIPPQPGNAFGTKPFLPAPNDSLGLFDSPHDLGCAVAIRGQQDNLRPPDMLLGTIPIGYHRLQRATVGPADLAPAGDHAPLPGWSSRVIPCFSRKGVYCSCRRINPWPCVVSEESRF